MDTVTQEWIRVINSGRAYSKLQPDDLMNNLEALSVKYFSKILRGHISKEDEALEAGCGSALNSFCLAYNGIDVTSLDISEKLIQALQQVRKLLSREVTSNLQFVVGDVFQLNKLDKKFSLVFNHGVYEHWICRKDRDRMLQSISSVLADKGKYVVAVPNLKNPLFHAALSSNEVPDMYKFTLSELEDELIQNGFKIVETGYLFVGPGFEQWLKRAWMAYPIRFIDKFYPKFPNVLRMLLGAHMYCVAMSNSNNT